MYIKWPKNTLINTLQELSTKVCKVGCSRVAILADNALFCSEMIAKLTSIVSSLLLSPTLLHKL